MDTGTSIRKGARSIASCAGLAAGAYGAYAAVTWLRYGRVATPADRELDELLDRFMPAYEVVERHHVRVNAAAAITFAAAKDLDMNSAIARRLFNARALALGGAIDRPEVFHLSFDRWTSMVPRCSPRSCPGGSTMSG